MEAIQAWFEAAVPFDGRTVPAVLRVPTFARIASFTYDPFVLGHPSRVTACKLALLEHVETFEGRALRLSDVDRIVAQPLAHASILQKRNELYERGRHAGVAWALCPHCREGEVRLSLSSYLTRLGAEPPCVVAADPVHLLPPSLSSTHEPGERPAGAALAARIRFELPSSRLAIRPPKSPARGVLGTIDPKREAAAWERWAPEGEPQPEDRSWWRRGNECFRAAVALSVAVTELDEGRRASPGLIVELPVFDVYFLDALYFLTHFVGVSAHFFSDECPRCNGRFFSVL